MRSRNILLVGISCLILGSCSSKEETGYPVLVMNTRFMREEVATVKVTGVDKKEVTYDFGDGTVVTGKGGETVTHQYTAKSDKCANVLGTNSGYIDYTVKVTADGNTIEKQVRVYDLLAIQPMMQWLTADGNKTVLNMCHRANTTNLSIPENSISAVKACIADGVDAIETDTQITSDGVVVISHDATINRCTNGTGTIANMTYAEIQQYYLLDRNGKVTTEKLPTLEEFLKAGRGKIYYDLDYSPRTASSEDVLSIVSNLNMMGQVWFYCNSVEKVQECVALDSNAQVYFWASNYEVLSTLNGKFFIQCSWAPTTNTSVATVNAAEAAGCITSTLMLDDVPTDKVNETYLDNLFSTFPHTRMIMNNVGDALLKSLQTRGLHY